MNTLNEEHSAMALSAYTHNLAIQHDYAISNLVEQQEYNIFSMLKPKIFKDGNQWCVLYGDNIQDGVCGFGDTPYKAVLDFNKSWNKQ